MNRRRFIGVLIAAPAIVRAESLMKIWVPKHPLDTGSVFYRYDICRDEIQKVYWDDRLNSIVTVAVKTSDFYARPLPDFIAYSERVLVGPGVMPRLVKVMS